ncbi:MAG: Lrp/AsnC ligand binding domain-containing protein [Candidatus Aenigmatarchaeota archaeon]
MDDRAIIFLKLNKPYKEIVGSLRRYEEIKESYALFGTDDAILMVEVRNYEHLIDLIFNKIRTINGIKKTKTHYSPKF